MANTAIVIIIVIVVVVHIVILGHREGAGFAHCAGLCTCGPGTQKFQIQFLELQLHVAFLFLLWTIEKSARARRVTRVTVGLLTELPTSAMLAWKLK